MNSCQSSADGIIIFQRYDTFFPSRRTFLYVSFCIIKRGEKLKIKLNLTNNRADVGGSFSIIHVVERSTLVALSRLFRCDSCAVIKYNCNQGFNQCIVHLSARTFPVTQGTSG